MIVIHWTGSSSIEGTFNQLNAPYLPNYLPEKLQSAGKLNVSSHFLVDRQGTIFQLMPEFWMARHTIGLNRSAIGIENIGSNEAPLTKKQLIANAELIKHLVNKFPKIEYLIGHHEYLAFYETPLWEELDSNYYSIKTDPGKEFMKQLNKKIKYLLLLNSYTEKYSSK